MLYSNCVCADGMLCNTCLAVEFVDSLKALLFHPYLSNQGMYHALQTSDWRDLFDVIIVGARKPSFYSDSNRLDSTFVAFKSLWISLRVCYVYGEVTVMGSAVLCPDPTL